MKNKKQNLKKKSGNCKYWVRTSDVKGDNTELHLTSSGKHFYAEG